MLKFRPHHFLCTLAFEGKGYSDAFVHNFAQIVDLLRGASDQKIQVVDSADSICSPCPNREGSSCASAEKIQRLDDEHALILGLKPGDVVTWEQAKQLLAEKMNFEEFHRACAPCSWKSMGVCEAALKKLKELKGLKVLMLVVGAFFVMSEVGARPTWAQPALNAGARPLDELREVLFPKKSKLSVPPKIKKSYELLQKGKTREARQLAQGFQNDKIFADYGYWLESSAQLEAARKSLQLRQYPEARRLAQSSIQSSLKILEHHPYSPWFRTASKEMGSAELIQAGAYCGEKQWALCLDRFEGAFQRLLNYGNGSGELWSVRPEFFKAYGQACAKTDRSRCTPWVGKLNSVFKKNSPEFKALAEALPQFYKLSEDKPSEDKQKSQQESVQRTKTYRAPDLDQAAFDEAMSQYLDKSYSKASKLFRKLLEDYPQSGYRFRARYWLARALAEDNEEDDARHVYEELAAQSPLTFYGMLASQAIGKEIGAAIVATIPAGVTRDTGLSALEIYRLDRAEKFLQVGAKALAAFELKDLKVRESLSSPFLIYFAMLNHEAGNHLASFLTISELIQRGYSGVYSTYVLKYIFPTPFFDSVQLAANENQLDPVLLLSLIKQESSFDSTAVSSAGAQGLTQLMPATALDVSPNVVRAELLDVQSNVQIGAKYLSGLLGRFKGNIVFALSGYNAGPGAVDRWVKSNPDRKDLLEFIESIPYRETREYVAAIIRNYFWYSHFLKGSEGPPLTLNHFWTSNQLEQKAD